MSVVSVIIPNFNSQEWLPLTLDSCLNQKQYLKDIIIIDDFSTDESWAIIEKYKRLFPDLIKPFRNLEKGGNHARNFGFSMSSGDYIQWLDADDQISPEKYFYQLKGFADDRSIDIVLSDWKLRTYLKGNVIREEIKKFEQKEDYIIEILRDAWSPPNNYLIKREFAERLQNIHAWNPKTSVMQDREYFTTAAILGAKFKYVSGCFSVYNRWNKDSVSAAKIEIRYQNLEKILSRAEILLRKQDSIQINRLEKYQNIINTNKLLIRAAGFPSDLHYGKIKLANIDWNIVKGIRTTVKVVKQVLLYRSESEQKSDA